ncbi:MAG: fibronectin type III domain-containing protein [Terriglobales bacterium]
MMRLISGGLPARVLGVFMLAAALNGCGGADGSSAADTNATGSTGAPAGQALPPASAGAVTLSWAAPTENTDGSALTNLAGFDIYYGPTASAMTQKISISTVGMLTYVITDLSAGTWFFEVLAVNSAGAESNPSGVVSATIT